MPLVTNRPATEFNTRGPFDNSLRYNTDDRVSHNGMSYVAPEPIPAGEGVPNPGTNRWIDDPGSEGETGKGIKGDSVRAVYIRAETPQPTAPIGTWDGRTLTLQGGWSETIPSGTETLYRSDVELDNTANTATFTPAERWTGPVGPEPSDTRLNALLDQIVTDSGLQTVSDVGSAIVDYLTDNGYLDGSQITEKINAAYLNVLRDLGAIQVQYSLDGQAWSDTLNTYAFVRIRLNNPDAEWRVIEVGTATDADTSETTYPFSGALGDPFQTALGA